MEPKVFFKNSKGNKLCGVFAGPFSDKNKLIVLMCHGFSSTKNTTNFLKLKDILEKNHISSFRFDFYGHGESEGLFEDITVSEAVNDILQAIKYLKENGFKKISLLGSSFGGMACIMAASKISDLLFLVLKSPVSDYPDLEYTTRGKKGIEDWKCRGFTHYEDDDKRLRLNYSFFEDFANNDAYKAAPKINIPTLIVHGDKDTEVQPKQSMKLVKLIPNGTLYLVKGSDHRYTKPEHAEEMLRVISEFII